MSTTSSKFYGVDRDYIAEMTRKARQERSAALRALVASIFTSVTDKAEAETSAAGAGPVNVASVAHR